MPESIKVFENSLKDYLINVQTDAYNQNGKIDYKYNNLKVYMEPKRNNIPHFWVSVNISSACFQIEPLEALSGSLGSDERFVILWASRPNINGELKKHWTYLTNSKNGLISSQVKDEEATLMNIQINDINNSEIITGSGLRRKNKLSKFEKVFNKKYRNL